MWCYYKRARCGASPAAAATPVATIASRHGPRTLWTCTTRTTTRSSDVSMRYGRGRCGSVLLSADELTTRKSTEWRFTPDLAAQF